MRTDYDPKAVKRAMLREGAATLLQAVLLPFGFLESRHRAERRKDLRTLVFVHGLAATRASFFPMQAYLRTRGHGRHFSFNHRSGPSIEALAVELKQRIDDNIKGGRVDIVAHSLGGLVARLYLQELGGHRRVDRLITLGTPHRGTWASSLVPSPLVRQLEPDGPFIAHLNGLPIPERLEVLAIRGSRDHLMVPTDSAECPFGRNLLLHDVGHAGLLFSPSALRAVGTALDS
jgi:triacylglycerol lipase